MTNWNGFLNNQGSRIITTFHNIPTFCPYCNKHVSFNMLAGHEGSSKKVFVLVKCPACQEISLLVGIYQEDKVTITRSFPFSEYSNDFQKEINDLSPNFVKIYEQSLNAELRGYDTLVGMGLRKALDFLVTDFLKFVGIKSQT